MQISKYEITEKLKESGCNDIEPTVVSVQFDFAVGVDDVVVGDAVGNIFRALLVNGNLSKFKQVQYAKGKKMEVVDNG